MRKRNARAIEEFKAQHKLSAIIRRSVLALLTSLIVMPCWGATFQASTSLGVQIEPLATMTLEPASAANTEVSGNVRWYNVELVIRMNPGTTASLYLQRPQEQADGQQDSSFNQSYFVESSTGSAQDVPGDSPRVAFVARQNGRYFLRIGVRSPNSATEIPAGENIRLELKSSDQALHLIKSL